jgi:putative transposase
MKRKHKSIYPSDMSDAQWQVVAPVLRAATRQPGQVSRRAILDAIFYVQRTGCQWRYLPKTYPNWKTVYSCFWRWQKSGVWDTVLVALQRQVRVAQGRDELPTVAVIDSQSVKTTEKGGLVAMTATKK